MVLERLDAAPEDDLTFWIRAGRSLAIMHGVLGPRYGWSRNGWLGRLRQDNTWHDDGYEFFATRRILRWLEEPTVATALDATDRAGLERICQRARERRQLGDIVSRFDSLDAIQQSVANKSVEIVIDE